MTLSRDSNSYYVNCIARFFDLWFYYMNLCNVQFFSRAWLNIYYIYPSTFNVICLKTFRSCNKQKIVPLQNLTYLCRLFQIRNISCKRSDTSIFTDIILNAKMWDVYIYKYMYKLIELTITSMRRPSCFGVRCEHSSTCRRLVDQIRVSSHVTPIHDRCTSSQIRHASERQTTGNGTRSGWTFFERNRHHARSRPPVTLNDDCVPKTHAQCSPFRSCTLIHGPLHVNRKFQSDLEIGTPIKKRLTSSRWSFKILI